jgi:hypothetical protein
LVLFLNAIYAKNPSRKEIKSSLTQEAEARSEDTTRIA